MSRLGLQAFRRYRLRASTDMGATPEHDGPMSTDQHGVVFPLSDDGRRSTTAVGRAVVADALRTSDPTGALHAEQETNWRSGYLLHFRRLVEAGLASRDACLGIATAGLASLGSRMAVVDGSGDEGGLAEWAASDPPQDFETVDGHRDRYAGAGAVPALPRAAAAR